MALITRNEPNLPTQGALLHKNAALHADRTFAVIDGESISYRDFHKRAEALAKGMLAYGLKKGDHVGLLMPNCIDFCVAYYAAQLIGAVVVTINARYKSAELAHVLGFSDIDILFTTDKIDRHVNFGDLLFEAAPDLARQKEGGPLLLSTAQRLKNIVLFGAARRAPFQSAAELVEAGTRIGVAGDLLRGPGAADDVALMLFTSGTTAMPKACQISHRNLYQCWVIEYPKVVGVEAGHKIWCPLPCFHIGGVGLALAAISRGACFLSAGHYDVVSALDLIREYRPEHLYPGFFTMLMPLLRDPAYRKENFASVRSAWMVAPYETHMQMKEYLPPDVALHHNFGMTEGAGMVSMTRPGLPEEVRLRSNGSALDECEIRVARAEDDAPLALGQEGEIQFRGPNAFRGYYKDEAATRAAHAPGGWVKTGDCGRMDERGQVYFLGRIKDMLKVGGENVGAAEIEAYLGRHEAVALAQVVGRADEFYGEVPVAFVQLREGYSASAEELIGFCRGKLANFKVPREVIFVTEWPMSATKIQKFKLREILKR